MRIPLKYILFSLFVAVLMFSCRSGNHDDNDHDHDSEEIHNHDHDHDHDHDEIDKHEHDGLVMSHETIEEFGIELETVKPGKFRDVIKTSGIIESSASDVYTATAKKSGIIHLAPGISTGVSVKAGEKLASISAEGVEGGDVSKAATANYQHAKAEYERLKPLYEDGLVTASVFREAERAFKEASSLTGKNNSGGSPTVVSSIGGTVVALMVSSGEYVDVGSPVASIAKNTTLTLKAELPAREVKHLAELETANFIPEGSDEVWKLSELDGKKISGHNSVSSNGYVPVYFSFSGNSLSSPGGFAEVFLLCGEKNGVISVPRKALIEIQGNNYVYVATSDHSFEKRLVSTGANDGERVEIKSGLKEGDRIVSKGASVVRMAEVSSIAPPAHTHNH